MSYTGNFHIFVDLEIFPSKKGFIEQKVLTIWFLDLGDRRPETFEGLFSDFKSPTNKRD